MKICVFTSVFRPFTKGGAEVVAQSAVDYLVEQGHEVAVVTTGYGCGLSSLWPAAQKIKTTKGCLTVYRYYPLNLFSFLTIDRRPGWLRLFWHLLDIFNIHSYLVSKIILRNFLPDLVLTHNLKGLGYSTIRAVINYSSCYRKAHLHTIHDVQLVVPSGRLLVSEVNKIDSVAWYIKVFTSLNRWLFASPPVVVSSSRFLMDFYKQRGFFKNSRQVILPNPTAVMPLTELVEPDQQSPLRFIHIGQIEPHKGVVMLVEVFEQLLKKHPQAATLTIIGRGSQLDYIKQRSQKIKNIIIMGYVPHDRIFDLVKSAQASVFTSLCCENFPTAISESLALGVPVIAAQVPGMEQVKNGVNGYTFIPGDRSDLLKVLLYAVQYPTELKTMRRAAYNSARGWGRDFYVQKLLAEISNLPPN